MVKSVDQYVDVYDVSIKSPKYREVYNLLIIATGRLKR